MKTMKKIILLLVGVALSLSVFAQTNWKADPHHSQLGFSITHLGIADIGGLFNTFDANIATNQTDFSDAVFELSVDIQSINTEVEMRDNHLRSPDFFDVENHPKMTYKSTSIQQVSKDKYKLIGDLTLLGVTKEVTMNLWYRGTVENPQSKVPTSGFQLTGTLNRKDFNLGSKFPAPMLSNEVMITANGEFVQL